MNVSMAHAQVSPEVLKQIAQAVGSLRYGTVQVTVHNARVVQIDKIERVRLISDVKAVDRTSGDFLQNQSGGGTGDEQKKSC